jgi:hypothetical protein
MEEEEEAAIIAVGGKHPPLATLVEELDVILVSGVLCVREPELVASADGVKQGKGDSLEEKAGTVFLTCKGLFWAISKTKEYCATTRKAKCLQ